MYFLFQTDECHEVPVQRNKSFKEYVSDFQWFQTNIAFIHDQKDNPDEEHTQDIFILNMTYKDEIRNIVTIEWHSTHAYIANRYMDGNFKISSLACMMIYWQDILRLVTIAIKVKPTFIS